MDETIINKRYLQLTSVLDEYQPTDWSQISQILNQVQSSHRDHQTHPGGKDLHRFAHGTAFITFDFGIDGVSIEIAKYAQALEQIYQPLGKASIHMIAGDFSPQAESVLSEHWHRNKIEGINGWNKWENGQWFRALFEKEIFPNSQESKDLAAEIFKQAVSIAKRLGEYLIENQIALLIPVNIASNPGNMALTLGIVLVTELLGIPVINSNHDFYWESGKPPLEREPGEEPGIRDHFFHNVDNKSFFSLFESLYPWKGFKWLQVNINSRQSNRLVERFGFPKEKVTEISTCVDDRFFELFNKEDTRRARLRMGYILSQGEPIMHPIPIDHHLNGIDIWMHDQQPLILGAIPGLTVDPQSNDLIYLLQPTRIIARKRIERDIILIHALLSESPIQREFEENPAKQLVLHITGPTPKEHQEDLETVLYAYKTMVDTLPEHLARRVFLAFSVGHDDHPSFAENNLKPLTLESIYRMADAIVFPSETEGRGLPIIESSAIGIPIICSRYNPRSVFESVVGKSLPDELQIRYLEFPDGEFTQAFLTDAAAILLNLRGNHKQISHNKRAVQARYSRAALKGKFENMLAQISALG